MNKLTTLAAAALLAGSACAVTSSNIVGYQLVEVPNVDYGLFTPTFKGVGGDIDLSDIKLCDADGNIHQSDFSFSIQVMDEQGAFDGCDWYDWVSYEEGWLLNGEDLITAGDVTIPAGRAFCFANSTGEVVYLKVSGEVDLVNMNEIPNVDYVLWGNSTPVAIDLAALKLVDVNGDVHQSDFSFSIQVMDEQGAFDGCDWYDWVSYEEGWLLNGEDLITAGDVTIQPGEAFCAANSTGEVVYLKLPSPIK